MLIRQTIAIIGAAETELGRCLAQRLSGASFRLLVFGGELTGAEALVATILEMYPAADIEAMGCAVDASWEADIILLVNTGNTAGDLISRIRAVANQKIVISINDTDRAQTPESATVGLQQLLPYARIAFVAATPAIAPEPATALIAGLDERALTAATELMRLSGYTLQLVSGKFNNYKIS